MRNLFISAAFIEFSCRFSFMLGVLLDIRVSLFMSRWLLNIRKVFFFCFFAFLRRRQSLCVIDWLLIGGEKTCLRSAPLDSWLVCPKITETRRMSMSQDRKVSPRLLSHSKMSARSGWLTSRSADKSKLADREIRCFASPQVHWPSCEALLEPSGHTKHYRKKNIFWYLFVQCLCVLLSAAFSEASSKVIALGTINFI